MEVTAYSPLFSFSACAMSRILFWPRISDLHTLLGKSFSSTKQGSPLCRRPLNLLLDLFLLITNFFPI